ncbi:MAG: DUF58 domain-containing protein, partial [Dehalococcoidia bacterium]|nr:DUF58 domain-containing protein [Dehalococcoidia bacterium]
MRLLRRLLRFLSVRHRSLIVLIALFLASLILAFATGFWLLSRLANVILVAIPVAYLWTRLNLRGLEVSVARLVDRVQEGHDFQERITVKNCSWFTKLWLEVEDLSELPGHSAKRVISLPPRAERTWRTVSRCTQRGLYTMGPVQVTSGDLFGLFRRSRTFGATQHVLVYPRAIELANVAIPAALLPGEGRFRRPTHQTTPNASGVRPYEPGDSLNRIHWP